MNQLNSNSKIDFSAIDNENLSPAIRYATDALLRDLKKCFLPSDNPGLCIALRNAELPAEQFALDADGRDLSLSAADELGFVYGLFHISRHFLGVLPFWFWNDQPFEPGPAVSVPENYCFRSVPQRIRFRGWFVNDEVLVSTWKVDGSSTLPWEMIFEALLRSGGNTVIPGTDQNSRIYADLASRMGLYVTHHHAEPLGAEMFSRAYPDLNPSYDEHPELFHKLWENAIKAQQGHKVIWNLGFRGQGDCPFWQNDPRYDTDQSRGKLMSDLILRQFRMVKESCPDAVCSTNLYGETMELYQKGFLQLPDEIIRIWADNGYGRMVSRRQGNHNPRICSLPEKPGTGSNGIYYHISFYDLQAAGHVATLPNSPEFVAAELEQVVEKQCTDLWIINCSNVKPHVYLLDFVAQLWNQPMSAGEHGEKYAAAYYEAGSASQIAACLDGYSRACVQYGPNTDDRAGEQYETHLSRMLAAQVMINAAAATPDAPCQDALWACNSASLSEQASFIAKKCEEGIRSFSLLKNQCLETLSNIRSRNAAKLFDDSIHLQCTVRLYGMAGCHWLCRAVEDFGQRNYISAFYHAGHAAGSFSAADSCLRDAEHGRWHGFYANECLADFKYSAEVMRNFMGFIRAVGDGPQYYRWHREFLYSREDSRVSLILIKENHVSDPELYSLMDKRFQESLIQ